MKNLNDPFGNLTHELPSGSAMKYAYNYTINVTLYPILYLHWLLANDQPDAETSAWQRTTLTKDTHATGGIRTRNTRKRAAADRRLRPLGQWEWRGNYRHKRIKSCYSDIPVGQHSRCWHVVKAKGKAIPLQAWTDPEGSRRMRLPDFKTIGTWRS